MIGEKSRNRSPESNKKISEKAKERKLTEERINQLKNNFEKYARPAAIKWHKSKFGRKMKSQRMAGVSFEDQQRTKYKHTCKQCGKEYERYSKIQGFCSGSCEQRYRRDHGLNNIKKLCVYCGEEFITDKYAPAKFCSVSCSNYYRHNGPKE